MRDEIYKEGWISMVEKDLDQYGKLLGTAMVRFRLNWFGLIQAKPVWGFLNLDPTKPNRSLGWTSLALSKDQDKLVWPKPIKLYIIRVCSDSPIFYKTHNAQVRWHKTTLEIR